MAAAGHALRLCLRTCRRAPTGRLSAPPLRPIAPTRAFTTTRVRWAQDDQQNEEGEGENVASPYQHLEDAFKDMSPEELSELEGLIANEDETGAPMTLNRYLEQEEPELRAEQAIDTEMKTITRREKPNRQSFWYDEDDPDTVTEDVGDEFDEDDITSMAHGKLDEVREYRHYARIAAWEMPLLSKLAKPFEPPTAETPLRFRYTTYMGEFHPAEKKVVVQFSPADMKLTPVQAEKLKKLAGPRYNPEKDEIKMSCESFDQPAQNKRFLSDQVDALVDAAKDPSDTFEDVPLDTRHHHFKTKPKFPREWRLTPERKAELAALRQQASLRDAGKAAEGQLVDGAKTVQAFLNPPQPEKEALTEDAMAELVAAQRPSASKRPAARRAPLR